MRCFLASAFVILTSFTMEMQFQILQGPFKWYWLSKSNGKKYFLFSCGVTRKKKRPWTHYMNGGNEYQGSKNVGFFLSSWSVNTENIWHQSVILPNYSLDKYSWLKCLEKFEKKNTCFYKWWQEVRICHTAFYLKNVI